MDIDVIVPFHGRSSLLVQCLERLAVGPGIRGRVYVVDDASPREESQAALREVGALALPIEWVSLSRRSGFVGAVNAAWQRAQQPVSVILNNDTLPPPDLLAKLSEILDKHDEIAAAAPTSDNPTDLYQYRAAARHDFAAAPLTTPRKVSLAPYLTAMCLAVRREAVEGLPFDPIYSPGYFEDLDLCCRLRARGWQLAILEECRVRHLGRATFGADPNLLFLISRNYARYSARWAHVPEHRGLDLLLKRVNSREVNQ
jgi:GT2 family glycosyltransferase